MPVRVPRLTHRGHSLDPSLGWAVQASIPDVVMGMVSPLPAPGDGSCSPCPAKLSQPTRHGCPCPAPSPHSCWALHSLSLSLLHSSAYASLLAEDLTGTQQVSPTPAAHTVLETQLEHSVLSWLSRALERSERWNSHRIREGAPGASASCPSPP